MKTVKEVSELLDVSKQTIHYHLKSLPSNLKVNKVGNKSLIDDNTIDYLKTILNKKTTKESTKFDEKSTNKTESLNNKDGILNLLDNKDNWDVIKDGDKVTFKLKKTDELKNKVKEERFKSEKNLKFSEFDYTIEYVFNTKTNDIEKLVYEVNSKTEGATSKTLYKGSLEEINKEVKVEVPEEAKKALEKKA